jgi:hypothetical protein
MKKEHWSDVLKSDKPKRKPGEFNFRHELLPEHQGPCHGADGQYRNSRLKTFGGKFGEANRGRVYSKHEIASWLKKNRLH